MKDAILEIVSEEFINKPFVCVFSLFLSFFFIHFDKYGEQCFSWLWCWRLKSFGTSKCLLCEFQHFVNFKICNKLRCLSHIDGWANCLDKSYFDHILNSEHKYMLNDLMWIPFQFLWLDVELRLLHNTMKSKWRKLKVCTSFSCDAENRLTQIINLLFRRIERKER